ncbi:hypothetical protein ACFW04_014889 [Cataglyphis niger]
MKKLEYRIVIKFLYLKRKTFTEIKTELDSVYEDAAPLFTTVKTRAAKTTKTTEEMIDYVHQIVIDDRRLTLRERAEAAGISYEQAHILHERL